jgi:hypothetical protein
MKWTSELVFEILKFVFGLHFFFLVSRNSWFSVSALQFKCKTSSLTFFLITFTSYFNSISDSSLTHSSLIFPIKATANFYQLFIIQAPSTTRVYLICISLQMLCAHALSEKERRRSKTFSNINPKLYSM